MSGALYDGEVLDGHERRGSQRALNGHKRPQLVELLPQGLGAPQALHRLESGHDVPSRLQADTDI